MKLKDLFIWVFFNTISLQIGVSISKLGALTI